jgi:hypothetical protein
MIREGAPSAEKEPPNLQEGLQIAEQINTFLESQEDRPAALKTLQRAWDQALSLARHQMKPL